VRLSPCPPARQLGQARLVGAPTPHPSASASASASTSAAYLRHPPLATLSTDAHASRIQALEQQVQDLLRLQRTGPTIQQPLPEDAAATTTAAPGSPTIAAADGDVVDEDIVSVERADTLVEVYKSDMMPHFPFIIIPPHVKSAELRVTKPFLFLAILSVACFHDLSTQERLCHHFKFMVSDKVLYGGDDCLQLQYLQGLLIALAW
jgi:hypothetical protein